MGNFFKKKIFRQNNNMHIDRLRRHNRTLHTVGIAEGLTVTADVGASTVQVSNGTAIDGEGRFIVLDGSRTVDILAAHQGQTVLLVISYSEEGSDPATGIGGDGETRVHERPTVELLIEGEAPSSDTHIRLARIIVTAGGTVGEHQTDVRTNAGVRLGGELELRRLTLSRANVDSNAMANAYIWCHGGAPISVVIYK